MSDELAATVSLADTAEAAIRGADLVITATPSEAPIVQPDWLVPHATVISLGADAQHKQELAVEVLARADKVVADDWSQCIRLGEIHHAVAANAIELTRIHAELGKVLTGERSGREGSRDDRVRSYGRGGAGRVDRGVCVERGAGERAGVRRNEKRAPFPPSWLGSPPGSLVRGTFRKSYESKLHGRSMGHCGTGVP